MGFPILGGGAGQMSMGSPVRWIGKRGIGQPPPAPDTGEYVTSLDFYQGTEALRTSTVPGPGVQHRTHARIRIEFTDDSGSPMYVLCGPYASGGKNVRGYCYGRWWAKRDDTTKRVVTKIWVARGGTVAAPIWRQPSRAMLINPATQIWDRSGRQAQGAPTLELCGRDGALINPAGFNRLQWPYPKALSLTDARAQSAGAPIAGWSPGPFKGQINVHYDGFKIVGDPNNPYFDTSQSDASIPCAVGSQPIGPYPGGVNLIAGDVLYPTVSALPDSSANVFQQYGPNIWPYGDGSGAFMTRYPAVAAYCSMGWNVWCYFFTCLHIVEKAQPASRFAPPIFQPRAPFLDPALANFARVTGDAYDSDADPFTFDYGAIDWARINQISIPWGADPNIPFLNSRPWELEFRAEVNRHFSKVTDPEDNSYGSVNDTQDDVTSGTHTNERMLAICLDSSGPGEALDAGIKKKLLCSLVQDGIEQYSNVLSGAYFPTNSGQFRHGFVLYPLIAGLALNHQGWPAWPTIPRMLDITKAAFGFRTWTDILAEKSQDVPNNTWADIGFSKHKDDLHIPLTSDREQSSAGSAGDTFSIRGTPHQIAVEAGRGAEFSVVWVPLEACSWPSPSPPAVRHFYQFIDYQLPVDQWPPYNAAGNVPVNFYFKPIGYAHQALPTMAEHAMLFKVLGIMAELDHPLYFETARIWMDVSDAAWFAKLQAWGPVSTGFVRLGPASLRNPPFRWLWTHGYNT